MAEFHVGIPVMSLFPEIFSQSILHSSFFSDMTSAMKFLFTGKSGFVTGVYLNIFLDIFFLIG